MWGADGSGEGLVRMGDGLVGRGTAVWVQAWGRGLFSTSFCPQNHQLCSPKAGAWGMSGGERIGCGAQRTQVQAVGVGAWRPPGLEGVSPHSFLHPLLLLNPTIHVASLPHACPADLDVQPCCQYECWHHDAMPCHAAVMQNHHEVQHPPGRTLALSGKGTVCRQTAGEQ